MRRVSPRLWGLLTVLVSVVLLGACGSPPPQPKPTPTVGPQGFEVSLGPVTVSGPPGVAADGVTARIEPAPRPDAVVPLTYTPAAEPFAITMSDDSQPRQPVTVRLRIDEEQPGVLAFVLQDSRTGRWEGIPVTMNQREATVTIEHFSTGFFAWLDRSKVGRAGADLGEGVNDYLGARPEPPDCVNQTVTINGRVYAASIDNPQLYACVTKRDGRAVVSVHPGSPHVWRLTANVTEAKVGQSRVPLGAAEALTLAAFRLEHPGSVGYQTLLVPRGQEEFILADTATTATIDATMEPGTASSAFLLSRWSNT